jgi:hypothetical protein
MKTKAIILIVCAAIATLSFVSVKNSDQSAQKATVKTTASGAPSGGFMSADKL